MKGEHNSDEGTANRGFKQGLRIFERLSRIFNTTTKLHSEQGVKVTVFSKKETRSDLFFGIEDEYRVRPSMLGRLIDNQKHQDDLEP